MSVDRLARMYRTLEMTGRDLAGSKLIAPLFATTKTYDYDTQIECCTRVCWANPAFEKKTINTEALLLLQPKSDRVCFVFEKPVQKPSSQYLRLFQNQAPMSKHEPSVAPCE